MTLGYDTNKGEIIASMGTSKLLYRGQLSADRRTLELDSEGSDYANPELTRPYQDRIELVDDDHRVMSSQMRGYEGVAGVHADHVHADGLRSAAIGHPSPRKDSPGDDRIW